MNIQKENKIILNDISQLLILWESTILKSDRNYYSEAIVDDLKLFISNYNFRLSEEELEIKLKNFIKPTDDNLIDKISFINYINRTINRYC